MVPVPVRLLAEKGGIPMAQSQSRLRVQKATALLREEHHKVKKLFREYEAAGDESFHEKAGLFTRIREELSVHATIEEEIFYPAVEPLRRGKSTGEKVVKEAREEHKIVSTLLDELSELTPADKTFDAKMKVLTENVEHHAEEEETDMFPLFDQLSQDEQAQVTERLNIRKRELSDSV